MTDVQFSVLARRDLESIEKYYRLIDPDLGVTIGGRILAATRTLGETPWAGPAMPRGDKRKWLVPRTPYLIFYRVARDHIRILRVVHTARKIGR